MTGGSTSGGLTLRRGFAWNLAGEVTFSLAQWLLLVLLARLESPSVVGEFAFALALTAPVYLLIGLNLRVVLATDAAQRWDLSNYIRLRYLLNTVAFAVSLVIGLASGLRGEELAVVGVVAAAKATEATSQLFYGYFQRQERLDLVARSLMLRGSVSTLGFAVTLSFLPGLLPATVALWAGWLLIAVLHDRRIGLAMWRQELSTDRITRTGVGRRDRMALARRALPLGLSAGVTSLAVNVPRYLLVGVVGPAALGVYAALAYLAQVVVLVTGSMGNAVVSRLAQYHRDRRAREFLRLVAWLTGIGAAVTAAVFVLLALLGEWAIGIVLGEGFVDQGLLLALVLGAGLTTVQRSLARGLQAAHRFVAFLSIDVLTLAIVASAAPWLVRAHGASGAAWALNIGYAVAVVATAALLAQTWLRMRPAGRAPSSPAD